MASHVVVRELVLEYKKSFEKRAMSRQRSDIIANEMFLQVVI